MKIYFFIGTTAELIKVSSVIKEFKRRKIKFKIITSGQGKILFSEFIDYLGPIKADISLRYKGGKSSVSNFVIWAIKAFFVGICSLREELKNLNRKDAYIIVHGDTVSSLLGALIASFYRLKIIHIESGLRSFNFFEPFPEEISRFIISHLTDIHFCPNSWCVNNLKKVKGVKINTFQNTLIDIFNSTIRLKSKNPPIANLPRKYFVLIVHRQEHVIFGKKQTREIVGHILKNKGNLTCVFIMHSLASVFLKSININKNSLASEGIIPVPRLPYMQFMKLIEGSEYFITDGGSNQEEAYYLGKPCLILRKHTERIEGLKQNVVISKFSKRAITIFLNNYKKYNRKRILPEKSPAKIVVDEMVKMQ
jgi:UDP-N-acetylglucosamine 2-epimerase (non-hydrolysing)